MSDDKRYNGWQNYETWNVALWLNNDQGLSEMWEARAQEYWDEAEAEGSFTREDNATLLLADMLKNELEDEMATLLESAKASASMWADLLGAALSEVNWREIAEHYIEEVDKTSEEETEEV